MHCAILAAMGIKIFDDKRFVNVISSIIALELLKSPDHHYFDLVVFLFFYWNSNHLPLTRSRPVSPGMLYVKIAD